MEGIVAKRTLKKSYYNNKNINVKSNIKYRQDTNEKVSRLKKYKERIIYKISIQAITVSSILIFLIAVKYLNINIVTKSDFANNAIREYNKTYTFRQIKNNTINGINKGYSFIKPMIPTKIKVKMMGIISKFKSSLNKEEINKNDTEIKIYEESNNSSKKNVGASVDDNVKNVTVLSSVSSLNNTKEKIDKSGIKFKKPLSGIITSNFGAREEIFQGIDSYHTGIDIANDQGKPVVSSIDGTVTKATYNKYNGNFIEITKDKVVTKYCHLSKITVKKGKEIKSGEKIGEVGSTGYSTGPHLHFEIVYDGIKVDPALIVDFKK